MTALVAGVASLILAATDGIPTGADPGNWLAISLERLGLEVMSAEVVYLPLFPTVLAGLLLLTEPLAALSFASILSMSGLVAAVYFCSRPIGWGYAVASAIIVGLAGAQTEALAWGGYPQILATAFGLLGVFLLTRYYHTGLFKHLLTGLTFVALTLATHAMIGGLIALAVVVSAAHWIYIVDPRFRSTRTAGTALSTAGLSAIVMAAAWWLGPDGVQPTLNPSDHETLFGIASTIREAPLPWAIVAVSALAVLPLRFWPPEIASTMSTASGWAFSGVAFFLFTGEPRSLLLAQVGLVMVAVLGFRFAYQRLKVPPAALRTPAQPARSTWPRLLLICGVSMFAALTVSGFDGYLAATEWFRIADDAEIAALDTLKTESSPGDLVISSIGVHEMPVGWWVEGYARRSSLSGHDLSFLAFPEERDQAEIANRFFSRGLSLGESRAILEETGADFVAVDRRGPDAGWLSTEFARDFSVVDDSSNIVILRAPTEP